MMVAYTLRYDADYFVISLRAHRNSLKSRWLRWSLKLLCALGLAALAALLLFFKAYVVTLIPMFFLALLIAGPRFDYLLVRRRSRRHAQYGSTANVQLSDHGVKADSSYGTTELRWGSFIKAVASEDGVLLYLAPWHYMWLPDSALQVGDPARARAIVQGQIVKYVGG